MRYRRSLIMGLIFVLGATCALLLAAQVNSSGGVPFVSAPKAAAKADTPFDPHDITGKWNRVSPFETYSNVPGGVPIGGGIDGDGGQKVEEAPFTPAGKAKFDKNLPSYGRRQVAPRLGNDPQMMCDPMGVPRILNAQVKGPHATFEIVKGPGKLLWLVQWHHEMREVWTDGRQLPKADEIEPKWDGYSVGHWEGNTFVVDSVGFDERTWLDHNSYPHTEQMRLQERYRRLDANTLELVMTVTDPEYYTKPFMSDRKLFKLDRQGAKEWDPQVYCVPSEEFKFNNLIRDGKAGQ